MAETVAALEVFEPELLDELRGTAHLLVDLDHPPCAHHAQIGPVTSDPLLHLARLRLDEENGVTRPDARDVGAAECSGKLAAENVPGHRGVVRIQRELAPTVRSRVAVDRHTGAVRAPVAHLREHRAEVLAEPRLELSRLAEESDDPAHMSPSYTRSSGQSVL